MTLRASRMEASRCVLVLVDYQQRLMPAIEGGAKVIAQALRLAEAARLLGVRVIGTEENPHKLGPIVEPLRSHCEAVVAKTAFDACADGLLDALRPPAGTAPADVVIGGCEAQVCLLQTALGLLRAGHAVWVVEAASGSRTASDLALAMARLRQAGAVIVSPDMVMFEWLASCRHPRFGEVLKLVKAPRV